MTMVYRCDGCGIVWRQDDIALAGEVTIPVRNEVGLHVGSSDYHLCRDCFAATRSFLKQRRPSESA